MAPVGTQPLTAGTWVLWHLMRYAVYPRQPFIELRSMGIQSVHFPFPHVADIHGDVGCEWNRPAKMVLQVQEDRIPRERSGIPANVGNHYEIRGVLDQLSGIAMIRVIVVGPMGED